jgi:hypothetical protein
MIIERLSREHRNIEKLLAILERELEVFDRGDRPDYEVIRAIISYFEVYPEVPGPEPVARNAVSWRPMLGCDRRWPAS